MAEFPPGAQFGPYRILRALGVGGMGAVYAAEAPNGAQVALKVLPPGGDAEEVARFHREAEAHARVDAHPAVARVYSAGVLAGRAYLVMDLLPGGDLQDRLRRGPLPPEEVRALGLALTAGLGHIHAQGVLHRDLKPANVLFDEDNRPRLTDFGIARPIEASRLTQSGVILGTPGYMAPEQAGTGRPSAASDVFGLGATLYAALTGHPPFVGKTTLETLTKLMSEDPPPLPSSVPADLRAAVMGALVKDPRGRFPNAAALAEALQPQQPRSASGYVLLAGACALVGVAVGAALLSLRPSPTPLPTQPSQVASATPSPALAAPTPARGWTCPRPILLSPEGDRRTNLTANALVATWIDDETFVTIAKGGAYLVWQPDAQGAPRVARRARISAKDLNAAFPKALFRDGVLVWGGDDSPLRALPLGPDFAPAGPVRRAPLVPHRYLPLSGGRYLLASSTRAAIWHPDEAELRWSAPLNAPKGTQIVSALYLFEEQGQVETGGAIELLVAWSQPSNDQIANHASSKLVCLRLGQVGATQVWLRDSPARPRAFVRWRDRVLHGDNIGEVLTSGADLTGPRPLGLKSHRGGMVSRVHEGPIRGIAEGPEGTLVTLGSHRPELCVWNPETGELLFNYDFQPDKALKGGSGLEVSPNRRMALVVGRDRLALVSLTPPR